MRSIREQMMLNALLGLQSMAEAPSKSLSDTLPPPAWHGPGPFRERERCAACGKKISANKNTCAAHSGYEYYRP